MYELCVTSKTSDAIIGPIKGFRAYQYYLKPLQIEKGEDGKEHRITHNHFVSQLKNIMAQNKVETDDVTFELVEGLLIEDLMSHDYCDEKAWNDTHDVKMPVSKYIVSRMPYAVQGYIKLTTKQDVIDVVDKTKKPYTITVSTVSMDKEINDDDGLTRIGDTIADEKVKVDDIAIDLTGKEPIIELINRLARFTERTDTNLDVIIYTQIYLDINLRKPGIDRQGLLKLILTNLGITNYLSAKEYMNNEEFLEIVKDAAAVANKPLFLHILSSKIFCAREITETIMRAIELAEQSKI